MAAFVSIGGIQIGGASNCVGIFTGQNIQNGWDSHAPNLSTIGTVMGNASMLNIYASYLWNTDLFGQALLDQDNKVNGSPMWLGL